MKTKKTNSHTPNVSEKSVVRLSCEYFRSSVTIRVDHLYDFTVR